MTPEQALEMVIRAGKGYYTTEYLGHTGDVVYMEMATEALLEDVHKEMATEALLEDVHKEMAEHDPMTVEEIYNADLGDLLAVQGLAHMVNEVGQFLEIIDGHDLVHAFKPVYILAQDEGYNEHRGARIGDGDAPIYTTLYKITG